MSLSSNVYCAPPQEDSTRKRHLQGNDDSLRNRPQNILPNFTAELFPNLQLGIEHIRKNAIVRDVGIMPNTPSVSDNRWPLPETYHFPAVPPLPPSHAGVSPPTIQSGPSPVPLMPGGVSSPPGPRPLEMPKDFRVVYDKYANNAIVQQYIVSCFSQFNAQYRPMSAHVKQHAYLCRMRVSYGDGITTECNQSISDSNLSNHLKYFHNITQKSGPCTWGDCTTTSTHDLPRHIRTKHAKVSLSGRISGGTFGHLTFPDFDFAFQAKRRDTSIRACAFKLRTTIKEVLKDA